MGRRHRRMHTSPPWTQPPNILHRNRRQPRRFRWHGHHCQSMGRNHRVCPLHSSHPLSHTSSHRNCIAQLTGHTALVCQIQLSTTASLLATGGSDGRVITFSLRSFTALQRLAAHDSSVTSLQFDANFLITGGNDGRVRVFETQTGNWVRDLNERSESVWKVLYKKGVCAVMCKRAGKTVVEIWTFKPKER